MPFTNVLKFFFAYIYNNKQGTPMSNIKLKNLLAENMRRFKTKNLNEQTYDEKTVTLDGKLVTVLDSLKVLSAAEAKSMANDLNCRLLTADEARDLVEQSNMAFASDDRFPENKQQWKAWIQDPFNEDNPILWNFVENKEAPKGMLASRFLGIQL
jgi:hypothetical protein